MLVGFGVQWRVLAFLLPHLFCVWGISGGFNLTVGVGVGDLCWIVTSFD